MNHHSLFKCILITDSPDENVETEMDPDEALSYADGLTTCHPEPIDENIPANESVFVCEPLMTLMRLGAASLLGVLVLSTLWFTRRLSSRLR